MQLIFPCDATAAISATNSGVIFLQSFSLPKIFSMPFDQYHEPPEELSQETRTLARMMASLIEEVEAINWYEQRISVEKDPQAKAIMENAQQEEFKHFGMDLEFLLRKNEKWRITLQAILFKEGDIVQLGEKGEKKAD